MSGGCHRVRTATGPRPNWDGHTPVTFLFVPLSVVSTQLRDQSPGYHHVFTRGNNKRDTYDNDDDRWFFCITLERVAKKNGWSVVAYCLMRNHYHLVLLVGEKGLAAGMCELNTAYAVNYNTRHGRINHLFGKRYGNRPLRTEASVMNAVRYVVQNPRRAGGKKPLEAYVWSSYAATIGLAFARISLDREALLPFFGATPEGAIASFREFCSSASLSGPVRWQPP
jgi:putative transposase